MLDDTLYKSHEEETKADIQLGKKIDLITINREDCLMIGWVLWHINPICYLLLLYR